jgi:hypothetical protein
MTWISNWFLRIGALAGLSGMAIGVGMAAAGDHSQAPLHAHINLIGWVSMVLYGLVYRAMPGAANSRLAPWQFGLAVTGLITMLPGLAFIGMTRFATGKPFAILGALLTIAAMVLFVIIVFRATGSARRGDAVTASA